MPSQSILSLLEGNLLAAYAAAVGTVALLLNFVRYRHAVAGTTIKLSVEVGRSISEAEFADNCQPKEGMLPWKSPVSQRTHFVKVRNLGNVTAHVQDVWVETKGGHKTSATTSRANDPQIYRRVAEVGNIEVPPRSSRTFHVFSKSAEGYLEVVRGYAVDETGNEWRSRRGLPAPL